MNILLLDRHGFEFPEFPHEYRPPLEEAGHNVTFFQLLHNAPEYVENTENYLSQFDLAVAHPHWTCLKALDKELDKRPDFRVLILGIVGETEKDGRVIYRNHFYQDPKQLIDLVENGWDELPAKIKKDLASKSYEG